MTDESKLFNNKRSEYGAVTLNTKVFSTSIDPGQERLNQLGYKQVITEYIYIELYLLMLYCNRNFKEDYRHLQHLVYTKNI